jgi:hypothetical protein
MYQNYVFIRGINHNYPKGLPRSPSQHQATYTNQGTKKQVLVTNHSESNR